MLAGFCLTAVGGTAAAAPLAALVGLSAAWITGIGLLLLLIGYLLKRFVFPDDTSFEIWLVNGPFACGRRSHKHFVYQQEVHTVPLKDPNGPPEPAARTRHIYDNAAWLCVDYAGHLAGIGGPNPRGGNRLFRRDSNGNVYLKAGKYGGGKDPLVVERDTLIGTIGQPYKPHPFLQPATDPGGERFDGHTSGEDPEQYLYKFNPVVAAVSPRIEAGRFVGSFIAGDKKRHRFALWCEMPKEAYRALMDALYRPTVTGREVKLNGRNEVWLHIHTPLLLPKSILYIEFEAERTFMGKLVQEEMPPIKYTLDSVNHGGHHMSLKEREEKTKEQEARLKDPLGSACSPSAMISAQYESEHPASLKELEDGPNRFTIRLENRRSLKCTLKVRIDLYGKHEVCLPWEPLFCDGDISTDKGGHRWIEYKRTFERPR
jgi:hypothetical protein